MHYQCALRHCNSLRPCSIPATMFDANWVTGTQPVALDMQSSWLIENPVLGCICHSPPNTPQLVAQHKFVLSCPAGQIHFSLFASFSDVAKMSWLNIYIEWICSKYLCFCQLINYCRICVEVCLLFCRPFSTFLLSVQSLGNACWCMMLIKNLGK